MSDSQDNNKSKFSFDASTAKPVDTASDVKSDGFTFDPSTAKEDKKGIKGHAQDVGASLMGGLAAVPDTLVGLADMYTEGRAGKAIDDNLSDFYKLGNAQNYWQDQKTDVAKQQQQQFHDAEGIVDKTKVALQNPSMIANAAVESLPSMFLGGALGKATKIANPIAAAAIGEGAVMAGAQAEQIRQNSDDQMLNNGQEAASALTGGLGALFGFAGGRIAQKLGIGDIDSMIVSGRIGPTQIAGEIANTSSKSLPRRVIEGAISEGFLEELPQSISEQIIQNLATDKHWSDGVDDAAVMGTLAGMAMGGVANIPSSHTNNAQADNNNIQTESNPTSPLPQLGGPSIEGEYIPRGVIEQNTANVNQTNYEYTQFDSDASNRLGNNGFGSTDTGNGPTDPVQPDLGGRSYFDSQKPSERLGLNPDNGPMSSAAALAVDSGASPSVMPFSDVASTSSSAAQDNTGTNFSDSTAQAIQYGMGEIAQGAKEAALENTIQRLEKDGEVQLFKQDSIAKALEDQNYNVRLNKDGSASIIGVKNPSTNEWHGTKSTDSSTPALNMADTQDQSTESNASQQLATLQQRFDEAKTVPEKAKIRKEIIQLQNNELQPSVNSNDKLQPTDEPENRNSEVPNSTGNQFKTKSNTSTNDDENVSNFADTNSQEATSPIENQEVLKNSIDYTSQITELEQKFSSEKSVVQKNKIRNQINNLKSEFNNLPLDHGVLNVPLSKRGNIDKQIDQYKVEQSKLEKEKNDLKKMDHLDDQKIAKPAFESLTKDDFQNYANRAGIKLSEAKSELKSMAHWQPKKAIKVFDALKNSNNRDKPEKIYTPSNREIEVRNKLVEADQLIASNHGNGAINENYPQILQPRDRSRPSSLAQVNEIANNIKPKLLGNSPSTANGSPIISNDNIIESGNGRVMAIRKAYEQGKAENYKKWLSEQGYDISKMKNPVLVRERLTELSDQDRIAYTKESNERTTLDLSPTERAIADADKVLNIIEDYLGGDLNSSNNRQFVNKFVTGVVSTNERASVIGNDKALTQQGKRRIHAALVAAAYGDSSIIDQVFEDSDSEIKSIGNALTDAAGSWALMRKLAQQGSIPSDLDITSNLIEAVHLVHKARNEKRKLIELVAQDDIFEGELDQTTKDFLSIFYRGEKYLQARSREKVADALNYYANQAQKVQPGENLFGDLPKSESDLIRETYERQQNQETDKQQDIFSSSKSNDTNIRKIGTTGQRATTESKNEKTSKQSEVSGKKPIEDNLEQINLQANEAATSPSNNIPEPSQAQIEAGNYKKGHIRFQGLEIAIENPKGSERRGTDPNGKEWAHTMSDHYGYIKRTVGADSEQIDTYIGKNPESDQVFIVDQIDQETGNFDEHKVMLGFDSQDNATKAYQSNFDKGWKVGQIRSMTVEQFKDWLKNGDTTKPAKNDSKGIKVDKDEQKSSTKNQDNTESQDTDSTEQTDLISKMEAKLTRLEIEFDNIFNDMPFMGHGGTPFVDNSKGRQMKRNHDKRDERLQAKKKEIEEQKEKIDNMKDRIAQRSQPTKKSQKFLEGNPIHQGLFELEKLGLVKQWKKNPQYFFVNGLDKVALATWDGEISLAKRFPVKNKEELHKAKALIVQANELIKNNTKDFSRKTPLKSDEERKGTSPIETTFNALSVVSATRRVLSVLQHLKLSTTQDASSSGRINVSLNGIRVNKVRNVDTNGFSVQVISSFRDLPKVIQNDATYQNENGETQNYDVSGVWHNGTLYVVADQVYGDSKKQLTTFDAYEELLVHELIGHFGVQQLFGQEYKSKFQQLFNSLGGIEGIRKIAKDNGVDMNQFDNAYIKPFKKGVEEGYYDPLDAQQATVSELFAFIAQNAKTRPFVRQKLKEVIGYIRQWFRERGFNKFLSRYNDADLMMFLSEARKAVVDRTYFGKYKNQNISAKNDSDTPLYSRSRENKAGSTINQVRDVLIERFGKDTINELERQGKLEIIQDYSVDGVEGFYYNGKAVLVASNLTNESAIPTFLHELGGHAGFQNMMNQEQYNELMRQFDKLVEQGNPVAMAAKLLAEREQGNVRQQLEYLPYLLTLSSTMQQRNVIQRNALNKLIQNIVTYVKAWVFDNFGINLNLNPDDILALSERMVKQIERQSSLDTVRQKYHGTSQWMTAPNGAKTHLSEQQWLQVRTPEFKKWFGDWENDAKNASQVLDENGEPKVVYHGTATEFNEFRKGHGLLGDGIYLTDSFDTAGMYANNRGKNGFVLPLFVNIRNALKTTGNVSRDKVVEATNSGKYQGIVHQFEDQELIVALESNQVKIAEGNTGTFNSESADIRFSRSAKDIIDRLSKNLGDLSVKSVKEKTGYKFTDWLGLGLSTLGRRQLTEIYSKLLPQLNKYNDLAAQMDADKNDAGAEADSIVREWANLKDENQLADLMHDATLAKIDPAKPYVKGDSIIKYKQLRDDFNALTPEAQAMYIKARDAYKKHYAKVQFAIKERILRAALSSQKKADLIKQMDDQFYGYVKGVYFPLSRFGKYVVVTRNNLGQVESVSRAETMAEAQALRSELMQKYSNLKVDRVILDKEFSASRDAAGRGFMSNLFDEVANLGLSASEMVEFEDTLNQLYLSSMPDLSWAKHGIHRKGTAGFSQDARRAFAQNMFHGAGYLAKLRYGDQMAEQLDAMQKYSTEQTNANSNYDQPVAQRVIDEMNKRHEILMNPKSHPLSSALTSFGFIYYLGLSPAAAIVNLSQTALVAYPIMGAKWGFDKAATELLKASNDFRKGVDFHKVKWEGTKTDLYKTVSSDISKFLNKDEKQAYDDAVARGVIDVTQAHDLAGIAQGEDSGIMWKTRPIMRAASVMFHSAERFNREVTFIAAYRLARQSGSKHDLAFDQAVDATYKGHFDYSSGNRPRIMQGNVAKVLLLFKQFGQNMIYTLVRQTYQSIKGETDAERKEARKSLGAILAMHATFAGVLGLPMVGMLLSLASWAGGGDDDPWDAEVALRNYLAEAFGPTISNLLMKGAPRALTPADVSSRVGINNLLLPDVQEGLEGKRWAESAMAGALGPVAGIGLNVAKGTQEISEGHNLRGLETMLPVFLKNFAKTYRYGDEGVQDKTGVSIMDEVSSMDLLVQGMGFSPSDVRTANEGKSAIYQLDKKLNERRGRLMALWSRAKMMEDQTEMDNIWKDIENFNDKNPSRRITRVNLNQSYKNRQRRIDRSEDGIYLSRNRQEARSVGYFAFGE
ncbi:PLxRFG domain-containing protein [Acinetobacter guillouiae]|uniref:PLxRFG domain-containing protein n=1 Tax=Acinetobacter guillouiae TaxID=106649 RepID=UPI003AF806D2